MTQNDFNIPNLLTAFRVIFLPLCSIADLMFSMLGSLIFASFVIPILLSFRLVCFFSGGFHQAEGIPLRNNEFGDSGWSKVDLKFCVEKGMIGGLWA